jgi:hypothetical protein
MFSCPFSRFKRMRFSERWCLPCPEEDKSPSVYPNRELSGQNTVF